MLASGIMLYNPHMDWPWESQEFTRARDGVTITVKTDGVVKIDVGDASRTFWPMEEH